MACKPPIIDTNRKKYDAVLFDLDGVVTKVLAASWKWLFDESILLEAISKKSFQSVYLNHTKL